MKHLTLILPGLLWPARSAAAVCQDLVLPALCGLLSGAKLSRQPAASGEDVVLQSAGLDANTTSHARLRALGDTCDDDGILCADPLPLMFAREALMAGSPESLAVTAEEIDAVMASLNTHFADIGHFSAAAPARGYVRLTPENRALLASAGGPCTTPLSKVVGRRLDNYLPTHPMLRRWMNEIQMMLHTHPVNLRRTESGLPAVNSIWLWGDGALAPIQRPDTEWWADDPLAQGIAKWAGAPATPLPRGFRVPHATHTVALLDAAARPFLEQDIDAWRDALERMDTDWLAPARGALNRRTVQLTLILPGDQATLHFECRRPALWGLFRKPLPFGRFLETLNLP